MKRLLLGLVMTWSSFVSPSVAAFADPAANRSKSLSDFSSAASHRYYAKSA